MEAKQLRRGKHLKGVVLDEAKYAVEIILVIIIFIGLMSIAGISITDLSDAIGSWIYDIFNEVFGEIAAVVSTFLQGILDALNPFYVNSTIVNSTT